MIGRPRGYGPSSRVGGASVAPSRGVAWQYPTPRTSARADRGAPVPPAPPPTRVPAPLRLVVALLLAVLGALAVGGTAAPAPPPPPAPPHR